MTFSLFILLGILSTRPAQNPDGKVLTVRETVLSRAVRPSLTRYWFSADTLTTQRPQTVAYKWKLPVAEAPFVSYGGVVSRSEFNDRGGVFPSPDSSRLAVYRKDESAVGRYHLYGLDIVYPMNGTASEKLELCVCDTCGNILCKLDVQDFSSERYLTNVCWSPEGKYLFVQVMDREQHNIKLNMYRSCDGSFVRTLLVEHNDSWVEPLDPLYFIKGSYEFLYRTDNRDGYRNLYVCDTLGAVRRLTCIDADVEYEGNDGKWVYYSSYEVSPAEKHLYRIAVRGGKPQALTPEEGSHRVRFNSDFTRFIDYFSSIDNPGTMLYKDNRGRVLKTLSQASNPLADYAQCEIEYGTVKSADGRFDNHYRLLKPLGFDPSRKYPLLVYVYGGPHLQMASNTWLAGCRLWEMLMAQKGYVVYIQDNRGTPYHGAAYEKSINRRLGQAEMEDQMAGIQELVSRGFVDTSRIGVHGWSYGGFMTISLLVTYPDFFKAGVAGGPVIDWKWYEIMYGERYMDTPESNPDGFALTSLVDKASRLKADLLICQGMMDETVVPKHCLSFVQACVESGVQLEFFPYPESKHNMIGEARVHLYEKITDYFEEHLK